MFIYDNSPESRNGNNILNMVKAKSDKATADITLSDEKTASISSKIGTSQGYQLSSLLFSFGSPSHSNQEKKKGYSN